jgi:hypothetical protein
MGFSNETPDEADERRLRAVFQQAPIPETPSRLGDVAVNPRRRQWKTVAMFTSVAAGIVLGLFTLQHWFPPETVCVEQPPHTNSPFEPPPVDSLDLLTLDLSALEEIGKEEPQ